MLCCLGIYTLDLTSSKLCSTLMVLHYIFSSAKLSNIRHKDFRPSLRVSRSDHPPGFCNGLDWRALVEDKSPQLAKLRE